MTRQEIESHIAEHEKMRAQLNADEKQNREMNDMLAALPGRIADEIARRSSTSGSRGRAQP